MISSWSAQKQSGPPQLHTSTTQPSNQPRSLSTSHSIDLPGAASTVDDADDNLFDLQTDSVSLDDAAAELSATGDHLPAIPQAHGRSRLVPATQLPFTEAEAQAAGSRVSTNYTPRKVKGFEDGHVVLLGGTAATTNGATSQHASHATAAAGAAAASMTTPSESIAEAGFSTTTNGTLNSDESFPFTMATAPPAPPLPPSRRQQPAHAAKTISNSTYGNTTAHPDAAATKTTSLLPRFEAAQAGNRRRYSNEASPSSSSPAATTTPPSKSVYPSYNVHPVLARSEHPFFQYDIPSRIGRQMQYSSGGYGNNTSSTFLPFSVLPVRWNSGAPSMSVGSAQTTSAPAPATATTPPRRGFNFSLLTPPLRPVSGGALSYFNTSTNSNSISNHAYGAMKNSSSSNNNHNNHNSNSMGANPRHNSSSDSCSDPVSFGGDSSKSAHLDGSELSSASHSDIVEAASTQKQLHPERPPGMSNSTLDGAVGKMLPPPLPSGSSSSSLLPTSLAQISASASPGHAMPPRPPPLTHPGTPAGATATAASTATPLRSPSGSPSTAFSSTWNPAQQSSRAPRRVSLDSAASSSATSPAGLQTPPRFRGQPLPSSSSPQPQQQQLQQLRTPLFASGTAAAFTFPRSPAAVTQGGSRLYTRRDIRRGRWVVDLEVAECAARAAIEEAESYEAIRTLPASCRVWKSYIDPAFNDDFDFLAYYAVGGAQGRVKLTGASRSTVDTPTLGEQKYRARESHNHDLDEDTQAERSTEEENEEEGDRTISLPPSTDWKAAWQAKMAAISEMNRHDTRTRHPAFLTAASRLQLLEEVCRANICQIEDDTYHQDIQRLYVYEHRIMTVGTLPLENFLRRWIGFYRARKNVHARQQERLQEAERTARAGLITTSRDLQARHTLLLTALTTQESYYRAQLELMHLRDAALAGVVLLRLQEHEALFRLLYGGTMRKTRVCARVQGTTLFRALVLTEEATRAALAADEREERRRIPVTLQLQLLTAWEEPQRRAALIQAEMSKWAEVTQMLYALRVHYSRCDVETEEFDARQRLYQEVRELQFHSRNT